MNNIALIRRLTNHGYEPFVFSKEVSNQVHAEWNRPTDGYLDLAKKVGGVALAIFALPFALAVDGIFSLAALIYRDCCQRPELPRPIPFPGPAAPALTSDDQEEISLLGYFFDKSDPPSLLEPTSPIPVQDGGIPSPSLITAVRCNPAPDFVYPMRHKIFLRHALLHALQFHTPKSRAEYKTWIKDGIAGDNTNGEPRIDIHHWIAACSLAYCLTIRPHPLPSEIKMVVPAFDRLSPLEKASILLQFMVPEKNWEVNASSGRVLANIWDKALELTQSPHYRREVMTPIIGKNIDTPP